MTRTKIVAISLVMSILIGSAAAFVALPEFAKGRYSISPLLFPYAFLLRHFLLSREVLLPLVLTQFAVYGVLYAWAWRKGRQTWATTWMLTTHLAFGAIAALLCRVDSYTDAGYWPFQGFWPY